MTDYTKRKSCRKIKADDTKPCSVAMPVSMQIAIIRRAQQEDRSFSATIRRALEAYLSRPA